MGWVQGVGQGVGGGARGRSEGQGGSQRQGAEPGAGGLKILTRRQKQTGPFFDALHWASC